MMSDYVFPAAHLAGFYVAHVISSLPATKTMFTPLVGSLNVDGRKEIYRLATTSSTDAKEEAQRLTKAKGEMWAQAVFLNDEYTRPGVNGKLFNSITATFIDFETDNPEPTVIVVPYSPPKFLSRLKIHRPKLIELPEYWRDDENQSKLLNRFFEGASVHEKGSRVWDKHLDETV